VKDKDEGFTMASKQTAPPTHDPTNMAFEIFGNVKQFFLTIHDILSDF